LDAFRMFLYFSFMRVVVSTAWWVGSEGPYGNGERSSHLCWRGKPGRSCSSVLYGQRPRANKVIISNGKVFVQPPTYGKSTLQKVYAKPRPGTARFPSDSPLLSDVIEI
jgi:hypothetical protein